MKILLTGSSSGLGLSLANLLREDHEVDCPRRNQLNLNNSATVKDYVTKPYDVLINCAGTDIGGKTDFVNHDPDNVEEIMQVNLVSPVLLTQAVLRLNPKCKIVNITSTNNNRYWPNNLSYSLSKKALEYFGQMLIVEYPSTSYLEVRLGLTKTNFNNNRYKFDPARFQDIYDTNKHLLPEDVAKQIVNVMFNDSVKFIEISP